MGSKDQLHKFSQDKLDFVRLGYRTMDMVADHLQTVPGKPVDRAVPPLALQQMLSSMPMPKDGMAADEILTFIEENVMPWPMPTSHSRSYGWINSPPTPVSILADALASTVNSGLDGYDHPVIFMMQSLGRWLMDMVGFPQKGSLALLLSGGSAANLNAITVARFWAAKQDGWNMREEGLQGDNRPRMIIYTSEEAHSSIQRCVEQLGIGHANLRKVKAHDDFRMDISSLRTAIEDDVKNGHRPFCVVASAGSTNTGSIDPLNGVADICEEFGIWMHVDGAYGGIASLDPRYTEIYQGIERANSVTLDPHKWMQVPIDCGALLLKDRNLNREAFSVLPDYLRGGGVEDESTPWPYEYMFQLTYADRALKTWAALARLGQDGIKELVIRCNDVAEVLGELVVEADDLELLSSVSLSTVNFRYVPKDTNLSEDELNDLNEKISISISECGEAHIPTTKVRGKTSLRACFMHYENTVDDAHHLVDLVRRIVSNDINSD